jgi:ribokinase
MAETLAAAGIDTAALQRGFGASGMSVAITEAGGGYGAVIVPGENHALDPASLVLPAGAQMLLLQNELAPEALPALVAKGREAGLHVALNAAPAEGVGTWVLGAVDTLIVNRLEAHDLLGVAPGALTPAELVEGLQARAPRADMIVTLGDGGVAFAGAGQPPRRAGAPAVEPVSTHGAGDVFCGTWAAACLAGAGLAEAVDQAQAAAAAHVAAPRV